MFNNNGLKVLIIGYGSIGKRHARILKSINTLASIDLITKQNITDFNTFKNLYDIKDLNFYDYFVISSETYLHYEQLDYINQKVKDKIILVEKPLFHKKLNFDKIHNNIYVAYNLRFHPVIQKIKEEIIQEKILYINVKAGQYLPTWRPDTDYRNSYSASIEKGGGVLLDLSHEIDYILWLFGKIELKCSINAKISDLEIKSDDIITGIGHMKESSAIINFTMDYISKKPVREITIYTNSKDMIADFIKSSVIINYKDGRTNNFDYKNIESDYTYIKMHESILNNNGKDVCTYNDGLSVMDIIDEVRERE